MPSQAAHTAGIWMVLKVVNTYAMSTQEGRLLYHVLYYVQVKCLNYTVITFPYHPLYS